MAFSYTPASPTDVTRVRFHIGDDTESTAIFQDETIQFAIDEAGGWKKAVVWCLESIIAKMSAEPDITADWLRVDGRRSLDGYRALLSRKQAEFGVWGGTMAVATAVHTYRADSLADSAPTYPADDDDDE